jgi:hypothetical protein
MVRFSPSSLPSFRQRHLIRQATVSEATYYERKLFPMTHIVRQAWRVSVLLGLLAIALALLEARLAARG